MEDLNDKITGGSVSAAEWNQLPSEIQNIIEALGLALSAGDLNQLGKGIAGYVANGNFYTDSGAADAYVLTAIGGKQSAPAYTDGFAAAFRADNSNTGATTVNVAGLGAKAVFFNGAALVGGEILAGEMSVLRYDDANGRFDLMPSLTALIDRVPLLTKVVDIGDWDMDATAGASIAHGVTAANIRSVEVWIRNDPETLLYDLAIVNSGTEQGDYYVSGANVVLNRTAAGLFDAVGYDATSYNRGWITIQYTP